MSVVNKLHDQINLDNIEKKYTRASGNGGQNRNKRETCVVLVDKSTGVKVRYAGQRTQKQNEKIAYSLIKGKLQTVVDKNLSKQTNIQRLEQLDRNNGRRRTYKVKDGIVIDHVSNKKVPINYLYSSRFDKFD